MAASNYWDTYYKTADDTNDPSSFAKFCLNYIKIPKLVDVGCGLGQDSFYFSNNNVDVLGVDGSFEALNTCKLKVNENLNFQSFDFNNPVCLKEKVTYMYLRFILHSVSSETRRNLLQWAFSNLLKNGIIFIETRSDKDKFVHIDDHKRNFTNMEELKKEIENIGFSIDFLEEHNNCSPTKYENPILIRLVATKV